MRTGLAAALGALVLVLAGGASGASTPKSAKYIVQQYGFSIVLPANWWPVPRTVAGVKADIARAKKDKLKGLPTAYSFYLTATGKAQLKDYVFQGFVNVYPSTDPDIPQVAVQVVHSNAPFKASQLAAATDEYASALAQNKGAKVSEPKYVSLPEGKAGFVSATIPLAKGLTGASQLYLVIHDGKLYVLKFDVDDAAMVASVSTLFREIAENFRFL